MNFLINWSICYRKSIANIVKIVQQHKGVKMKYEIAEVEIDDLENARVTLLLDGEKKDWYFELINGYDHPDCLVFDEDGEIKGYEEREISREIIGIITKLIMQKGGWIDIPLTQIRYEKHGEKSYIGYREEGKRPDTKYGFSFIEWDGKCHVHLRDCDYDSSNPSAYAYSRNPLMVFRTEKQFRNWIVDPNNHDRLLNMVDDLLLNDGFEANISFGVRMLVDEKIGE